MRRSTLTLGLGTIAVVGALWAPRLLPAAREASPPTEPQAQVETTLESTVEGPVLARVEALEPAPAATVPEVLPMQTRRTILPDSIPELGAPRVVTAAPVTPPTPPPVVPPEFWDDCPPCGMG